jgi:hypothetical protein
MRLLGKLLVAAGLCFVARGLATLDLDGKLVRPFPPGGRVFGAADKPINNLFLRLTAAMDRRQFPNSILVSLQSRVREVLHASEKIG